MERTTLSNKLKLSVPMYPLNFQLKIYVQAKNQKTPLEGIILKLALSKRAIRVKHFQLKNSENPFICETLRHFYTYQMT